MALFTKGIVLPQHKEPAFSSNVMRFVNPQTDFFTLESAETSPDLLTADELIDYARNAGVVDERDGKFLYRKLLRAKSRAIAVIADAIDDEPYVSSQIAPMIQLQEEACAGLGFCERIAESGQVFIMAYKNITDLETRIPKKLGDYPIVRLRGGYPAEPQLEKLNLGGGRKLVVGTGALIHFSRAVASQIRQTTTFITVAGNCIANPMNLEVSLGMTVAQVLERCGLSQEPTRIVCGGPMTGIAVMDTENTLITPTTRAILAFRESRRDFQYSCIGCGRCERVCPVGLNPMYIYRFTQNSYFANLRPFDAHLCTGCGTCSYVCPSRLNIAGTIRKARQYAIEHFITPAPEGEDDLEA